MSGPAGSDPKEVAELVARYPRAARLVSLIKKVDDASGGNGAANGNGNGKAATMTTPSSSELLSALAALASDVLRAPLREVANGAAPGGGAATPAPAAATPAAAAATADPAAAAAAAAAETEAAFGRSLVVLEGVTLQAPRSGKADLGFGTECLRVRSAKGPMLTVPYSDIEHIIIMDKIPQQPDDRNGVMLALRRGATIAGAPPPPTSAAAAAAAPPDVLVLQTRNAPLRIRAPEVARHVGEWLEGPAAVIVCQLLGCLLQEVGEDTFLAADVSAGFRSSRGLAAVSANIKASGGWLFPLKTGFAYLGKPACFLRLGDVADVEYGRAEQGSSTFDLLLRVDDGGRGAAAGAGAGNSASAAAAPGRLVELAQIDASELPKLKAYFSEHKAAVGALRRKRAQQQVAAGGGGGGAANGGDWGSAVAPKTLAAMAGLNGGAGAAAAEEDEDEDSDEDDEDFNPGGSSEEEEEGGKGGGGGGGKKRATRGRPGDEDDEEGDDEAGPSAGAGAKRARPTAATEEEEDIGSEDSDEDEEDEEEDEDEDESLVPSDELSE